MGCSVEVAVGGLHQASVWARSPSVRSKLCSVVSVPLGVILKTVPHRPNSCCRRPQCRLSRRSSRRWLETARAGEAAVSAVEAVQRGQRAARGDFEDRAAPEPTSAASLAPPFGLSRRSSRRWLVQARRKACRRQSRRSCAAWLRLVRARQSPSPHKTQRRRRTFSTSQVSSQCHLAKYAFISTGVRKRNMGARRPDGRPCLGHWSRRRTLSRRSCRRWLAPAWRKGRRRQRSSSQSKSCTAWSASRPA